MALLDGNSITGYRTAATSALAADLLAPPGPLTVAVLGSGLRGQEARPGTRGGARAEVRAGVQPASGEPRRASPASWPTWGRRSSPAESPEAAVAGTSLVICAARSYDETPILLGRWLEPGMTVVSIGSTVREQREVDAEVIARADVVIADVLDEVLHDSGDLVAARQAGIEPRRIASLADLVGGRESGRTSADADRGLQVRRLGGPGPRGGGDVRAPGRASPALGADLPIRIQPVRK